MPNEDAPAVFTPDNEPYLGNYRLHAFDLTISRAMQIHTEVGARTFATSLTPLQAAATEIIPQGVSIALSIRELIRQAYLYSAAVLVRPLVERTGMIQFLAMHPEAVSAWHAGWPRKSQPEFKELVALVMPRSSTEENEITRQVLHKLIHSDPEGSRLNMFSRPDGSPAFASGKELTQWKKAETISAMSCQCLRLLTATSVALLGQEQSH